MNDRPPAALEIELKLLQYLAALVQLWSVPVWEGQVVHADALLPVRVQEAGDSVLMKLSSGAENKHLLHTLVLELPNVSLQISSDIFEFASWQGTYTEKLGAVYH